MTKQECRRGSTRHGDDKVDETTRSTFIYRRRVCQPLAASRRRLGSVAVHPVFNLAPSSPRYASDYRPPACSLNIGPSTSVNIYEPTQGLPPILRLLGTLGISWTEDASILSWRREKVADAQQDAYNSKINKRVNVDRNGGRNETSCPHAVNRLASTYAHDTY